MVIDLEERRAERERRDLQKYFNPSVASDYLRCAAGYAVVVLALATLGAAVAWAIVNSPRG